MNLKNLHLLHIIRGFAALYVMLCHAKFPFWIGGTAFFEKGFSEQNFIDQLGAFIALSSSNGTAMVIIFFVLSGFMISHSYKSNKWQYKHFLINRAIRIYLPYIGSALLAGLLLVLSFNLAEPVFTSFSKEYHNSVSLAYNSGLTIKNFLATLLFYRIEGSINYFGFNYVYWSLLFEAVFYFLFPIILRYNKQILILSIIIHPIHFYLKIPEMDNFLVYFFVRYLFYFSAGVWFYMFVTGTRFEGTSNWKFQKLILAVTIACLFIAIVLSGFVLPKGISYILATAMTLTWIYFILKFGVSNNFMRRALVFLGEVSFSLYLIHVPVLLLLYSVLYSSFGWSTYISPWAHLLTVPFVLGSAYIFYLAVEKPSFKIIRRYKRSVQAISNSQHGIKEKNIVQATVADDHVVFRESANSNL